jgi:hypothetical protein
MKILLVHGIDRSDVDPNQTATPRAQDRAGINAERTATKAALWVC